MNGNLWTGPMNNIQPIETLNRDILKDIDDKLYCLGAFQSISCVACAIVAICTVIIVVIISK